MILGSFLYCIYNLLLYLIEFFIPSVKHGFRFFCSTENVLTGKQSTSLQNILSIRVAVLPVTRVGLVISREK